jgi:hypothetical protein
MGATPCPLVGMPPVVVLVVCAWQGQQGQEHLSEQSTPTSTVEANHPDVAPHCTPALKTVDDGSMR